MNGSAAEKILSQVPADKAFHFYFDLGRPLDVSASSLKEFGEKLAGVEAKSLEFHTKRGDFPNWVYMLGDGELAASLLRLRESSLSGEKLRSELERVVRARLRQLQTTLIT